MTGDIEVSDNNSTVVAQTSIKAKITAEDEIKEIDKEIKADETNLSGLKNKVTIAEKTLADHKELLQKKKDLT
jgi:ribonuclease HII